MPSSLCALCVFFHEVRSFVPSIDLIMCSVFFCISMHTRDRPASSPSLMPYFSVREAFFGLIRKEKDMKPTSPKRISSNTLVHPFMFPRSSADRFSQMCVYKCDQSTPSVDREVARGRSEQTNQEECARGRSFASSLPPFVLYSLSDV